MKFDITLAAIVIAASSQLSCGGSESQVRIGSGSPSGGSIAFGACADYQSAVGRPALEGLVETDSGTVGDQSFASWVSADLPVKAYTLPNRSIIYESQTVYEDDVRTERDISALRQAFGTESQLSPTTGGSRTNAGYERAVFNPDSCVSNTTSAAAPATAAAIGHEGFAAETRWYMAWGWQEGAAILNSDARYQLSGDALYVDIGAVVRTPVWNAPLGTPLADIQTWEKFSCALGAHENLHIETVRAAARQTLAVATSLRADTPQQLYADLDCLWQYGLSWGNREDERVDSYSGHGPKL